MKIPTVEAELVTWADRGGGQDRRADTCDQAKSRFSKFCRKKKRMKTVGT
jgi:hypothetical protein